MDAMGLTFKKPHTVSTSLSGTFNHNPAESPKFPGIVSTAPAPPGLIVRPASLLLTPLSSSSSVHAPFSLTCLQH